MGEQTDAATGNVFLRARYLSPSLGRFLSADTLQPNAPGSQGYNLYGYVANNPATWIDPSGHSALGTAGAAGMFAFIPALLTALACNGLCALIMFLILVFLVIAFILDCFVLGPCDAFAPQRDRFLDGLGDLFSPSGDHSPPPLGPPSADPGTPSIEIPLPWLPNWQWDTPKSTDPGMGGTLNINPGNLKDVSPRRVEQATGLNPEEIKREYLGERADISKFDLKRDPASGRLVIVEKATQKIVEVTRYVMESG